jgi:3'-phosphoadenosine 5'-phosphosulfate (PAPS) 3'-phosphatase
MKIDLKISNIINQIAIDAGREIIKIYNKPFSAKMKKDRSPVTKADLVANDLICKKLHELNPKIQIISEEGNKKLNKWTDIFWLVDPLDGTKEFIKKKWRVYCKYSISEKWSAYLWSNLFANKKRNFLYFR